MDLSFTAEYEGFRQDVRAFLQARWIDRADRDVRAFRAEAIGRGYLYRAFPKRYGGGERPADVIENTVIVEEFARARAPGEVKGMGTQMLAPTLLDRGEEWQKERFIAPTLAGEISWCQGYSEPGAGSDLASLRTRGDLIDGEWVIEGQKVWTSFAKTADYMFALVRTEPDAPKHEGLSYLLIDMKQPGIDIRPLKQITGEQEFNEVFLSGVRTPADWIVGQRGQGWEVSRTLLRHERNMLGGSERLAKLLDSLVKLARRRTRNGAPAIRDPMVRDRLAALSAKAEVQKLSAYTQLTRELKGVRDPMLPLLNKLAVSEFAGEVAALAMEIIESDALMMPGEDRRGDEKWTMQYMNSLAAGIAGGTSNIQRNIIAERGLGLPR
ncbi:acyl-CoA dehydrogenase family protein [Sphingomonas flavalba]|uniref:acyl-CoA dehydrogenase family protein n=1 Tax=Sphingomonas flavalba TaxID=2559804 RepID=UPI0039E120C2